MFSISKLAITPFPELYYDQQGDRAKQSEYAVTTVFALSTRHLCDSNVLRNILQKYEISQNVVNEIVRVYEEHSKEMILRQLQLGHNHPHITELQWRIVCDVKSTTMHQSSGEVGFQINLGRYANGPDGGQRETIAEFICNTEELQSFINKLKEIERHCEKLTLE